jgi:hypothetical protein
VLHTFCLERFHFLEFSNNLGVEFFKIEQKNL